ncbi:MAG: ATP-binding protein [Acidobacteriota bacterium]
MTRADDRTAHPASPTLSPMLPRRAMGAHDPRILERCPTGVAVLRVDGSIDYANPPAAAMLGVVSGAPADDVFYHADARELRGEDGAPLPESALPFVRVRETGAPVYDLRHSLVAPDGRRIMISVDASPLLDDSGRLEAVIVTMQNITDWASAAAEHRAHRQMLQDLVDARTVELRATNERLQREVLERRRVEAALADQNDRLDTILATTPDQFSIFDVDGRYRYASPVALRVMGFESRTILGRTWRELGFPEDICSRFDTERKRVFEHGETVEGTFRFPGIEGDRHYEYIYSPVWDTQSSDGQTLVVSMISTVRDVTSRKRAEDDKTDLEKQLRQSQKMEAIGRLAGGIAHDFNNLLTSIMSYASLAADLLPEDHPVRDDLAGIQKATDRAAGLTRQLLAFASRQVIEPRIIQINEMVHSMSGLLRRLIGEDIALEVNTDDDDAGSVRVDPSQLEQVIINLVVNARDAMPGGGRLVIETESVILDERFTRPHADLTPGPYVCMVVSDNGCGIPEDVINNIFEPFFTTKAQGKGTGLGLSTCFGIVRQSGGHIAVESAPGSGAVFRVYLPESSDDETLAEPSGSYEAQPLHGNETILLVEDEDVVRTPAARLLKQQGYTVLEASSGREALTVTESMRNGDIDLMVSDVVMPQMGGKELADILGPQHPHMKILFISGYVARAQEILSESDAAFLQKPFQPRVLARRVRELLESDSVTIAPSA